MKYVSIDIETTGLDSEKHKVLSIAGIIEDTETKLPYEELPKFNVILLQDELVGSPFALTMNAEIIKMIGDYREGGEEVREDLIKNSGYQFLRKDEVSAEFFRFLYRNNMYQTPFQVNERVEIIDGITYPSINNAKPISINVAGKNFGTFDKLFLEKIPRWKQLIRVRQRIIDPAILHCNWNYDEKLPSLNECKIRSGIQGKVSHEALEDAWDVIQVLRKEY